VIRAAGGIVERDGCVLLVHRPKYDDWSFPKGKLDEGETWEQAALREVEEETGLRCELGDEVGRTHYPVLQGPKEVRYYRMTCAGDARAQNEVDDLRWVPLDEAAALLSHQHDRDLLSRLR
jgi:8-oxo-dGTP diphosphatase